MRVALACPYAWDTPGGVQVHVRGLADALARRGHDAMILTPASGPVPEGDVRVIGRPVRIPYGGKVAPITPSHGSWRRVREALRVFEPDVVHVHEPFSPSTSMFATLASEVPVVATFHAFHERSRLLQVAAPLLRQVASRIAAPIAVSQAAAAFVASVVRARVEIVPNGVDVGRFEASAEPAPEMPPRPAMLWASRLDPQKGFPIAVRAFAELLRTFDAGWGAVVGAGADDGAVDTLPAPVRERVRMLGAVPNRELHRYHAGADVYVAPATGHESFGLILVEAMAAGVPVVATDIPGYREVIRDGVDGSLVPPGDPHALAVAVGRVLGDRDLRERLRANARERARTYGWDAVAPTIEAIYERVAGGRSERLG